MKIRIAKLHSLLRNRLFALFPVRFNGLKRENQNLYQCWNTYLSLWPIKINKLVHFHTIINNFSKK